MLKVSDTFINTNPPSADYPNGSYKNDDVAGDKTGTPIDAETFNDILGFSDALLAEAGIEPSGDPDKVGSSDRLRALRSTTPRKISSVFDTAAFANLQEGDIAELVEYHPNSGVGGSPVVVRIARHNGGTAISLTRVRPNIAWTNEAEKTAWFADSGVDELCAVRTEPVVAEHFGLLGDATTNNTVAYEASKRAGVTLTLGSKFSYLVDDINDVDTVVGDGLLLDSSSQKTTDSSRIQFVQSATAVVNMHFGVLKGYGFDALESGGEFQIYTITSPITAGDTSFTVLSISTIVVNQLLAFKANDGTYFSGVVKSINGLTITMKDHLEKDVNAGDFLFNFYKNTSHPTTPGYKAIADFALSKPLYSEEFIRELVPAGYNTGSVSVNASSSYANLGSATLAAWTVTATNPSDGCTFSIGEQLRAGNYIVYLPINVGQNNSLHGMLKSKTGGYSVWSDSAIIKEDSGYITIEFFVFKEDEYELLIFSPSGGDTFFVGAARLTKKLGRIPNLNQGTHVMLGDSWFDQGPLVDRLAERLPLANIINKGIGGQQTQAMSARFNTDVKPYNPDFVWLITGTNDYYADTDLDTTNFYLAKIRSQCAEIGAQLIVFTNSVGESATPRLFDDSRRMAARSYIMDGFINPDEVDSEYFNSIVEFPTRSISAGETVYFGFQGLKNNKEIKITEHYFSENVDVVANSSQVIGVGIEDILINLTSGYSGVEKSAVNASNKWVFFKYENTTASSVVFHGYAKTSSEV